MKFLRYGLLLSIGFLAANAFANQLLSVRAATLPGNESQVILEFSESAPTPLAFAIENPPRIAFDFPGVVNALPEKSQAIDLPTIRSFSSTEVGGRTRLVLNLNRSVSYETEVSGRQIRITLGAATALGARAGESIASGSTAARSLNNVDFRIADVPGNGRAIFVLSQKNIPVQVEERGNKIFLTFNGTTLPSNLNRRFDVSDFSTPVTAIDVTAQRGNTQAVLSLRGDYDYIAYESENNFIVEVNQRLPEAIETLAKKRYTGDRLSLNFQDIEVRSVLQILADFTSLNVVVSDSVGGNITLRLKDVPWDQALDIILKTKGLDSRDNGNVIYIAPIQEIATQEKLEQEARQQSKALEPLRTEILQVNFAKAADMATLFKGEAKLISERGSLIIDARTNKLIVRETLENLGNIKKLLSELDIPVRQVLVESRIVIASNDFSRELGVKFGVNAFSDGKNRDFIVGGSANATDAIARELATGQTQITLPSLDNRLNVNAPTASPVGQIALALLGKDYLVDLELNALQAEGNGEIISTPRVVTTDGQEAFIKQGVQIPYKSLSDQGADTQFKDAALSVTVTPQITPDDRVFMNLVISKSSPGQVFPDGVSIDTRELSTSVLVNNGDTIVLGGIFEETNVIAENKVPVLGDIPIMGRLFKNNLRRSEKDELLIFVTPKILKENLSASAEPIGFMGR
jgi:type IV pilus assembly protein PilQ